MQELDALDRVRRFEVPASAWAALCARAAVGVAHPGEALGVTAYRGTEVRCRLDLAPGEVAVVLR